MSDSLDADELFDRLAQEFVERARRGEAPSIEDYARAHADIAGEIRELFPLLAVVEGLKDPGPQALPTAPERSPPGASVDPALPRQVGAWRIVGEIGRGGMGSVHEGRGADGSERVAVKVVHPHLVRSPEYVARFLREAEAGLRVEHPNVVRALETGVVEMKDDEVPYLVLEYVDGQNLRQLLDEVEVVPERLCRHVAHRLACALGAIHAARLVHRDVKPENVVIAADETVKLMDLGVAVLQEEAGRLSQTGQFVGSLLYAAPEQLLGGDPDPRWDLYALGVLLYELATGRHPARVLGARWLDRTDPVRRTPSPREANPGLSPFYDMLVRTLLAPETGDRFATASEVRVVLEEGEASSWWHEHRARIEPATAALQGLDRPTRFVGRASEWRALDRLLDDVQAGSGRVAFITGEAGIGKTRFLHEWIVSTQEGTNAPEVLVVPHGPGVVGGDEGGLAAALLDLLDGTDLEDRLAALLASRPAIVEPLARHLTGASPTTGDAELDAASLDGAYVQLLAALSRERPLILALEDLHYASEEARSRFLLFARALVRDAILVLGTTRTVPAPTWAVELERLVHVTRLDLDGLDAESCRVLVREAAKSCAHFDPQVAELAERSDRNPFLLLEFVRDCIRRQPQAGDDVPLDGAIPPSIRGFLTGRLALLEPEDRELLEAAACCGHEFDPVVVAHATGAGRIAALKHFGRLERQHGLLRPSGRHYVFQHHLVQELLYSEIHTALRETYHAALGDAFEQEATSLGEGPRALALATHFLEGGQPLRMRPYVRRALEHLETAGHNRARAADLAGRALAVEGLFDGEDRAHLLLAQADARVAKMLYAAALEALAEALDLAQAAGARALEVDLQQLAGSAYEGEGRRDEMHAAFASALETAHAMGDGGREASVLSRLGLALSDEKRTAEAEACFHRGFEALRGHPDPRWEGRLIGNLARMEVHRANFEEGERLLRRSRELAHQAGDMSTEVGNYSTLGQLAARRGELAKAIEYGTRGVELGRQIGLPPAGLVLSNLAYILMDLGRFEEAAERANEAVAHADQGTNLLARSHARLHRGQLRLLVGALADAKADLEQAYELALEVGLADIISFSLHGLVWSLTLRGRGEDATRLIEAAVPHLGDDERRVQSERLLVAEMEGRFDDVLERAQRILAKMRADSRARHAYQISLGRALVRTGRKADATELLRDALSWGRSSGVVRYTVLAETLLAALGKGETLAARLSLEKHEGALSVSSRMEAHLLLWETTDDATHLVAARAALATFQEGAPPEDQKTMVENVDLHRRVATAKVPGS